MCTTGITLIFTVIHHYSPAPRAEFRRENVINSALDFYRVQKPCSSIERKHFGMLTVIHLQFWAYGSRDSLFPIRMSPTAKLWDQNTIFHGNSAIPLHPRTRWNKNFASQRQTYAQKMQYAQVKKNHWLSVKIPVFTFRYPFNTWTSAFMYSPLPPAHRGRWKDEQDVNKSFC